MGGGNKLAQLESHSRLRERKCTVVRLDSESRLFMGFDHVLDVITRCLNPASALLVLKLSFPATEEGRPSLRVR